MNPYERTIKQYKKLIDTNFELYYNKHKSFPENIELEMTWGSMKDCSNQFCLILNTILQDNISRNGYLYEAKYDLVVEERRQNSYNNNLTFLCKVVYK